MSRLFNANNGNIQCTNNSFLRNVRPFTVAGWIMPGLIGGVPFGFVVAMDKNNGADGNRWTIDAASNSVLRFIHTIQGGTAIQVSTQNKFLITKQWQFIVVTYNGGLSTTNVKMYRLLQNSTTIEEATYQTLANGTGNEQDPDNGFFQIGDRGDNAGPWDGLISHVQYYRGRLNMTEMLTIAKRPGSVRRIDLLGHWGVFGFSNPEPDLSGRSSNGNVLGGANYDKREPPIVELFMPRARPYFPYTVPAVAPISVPSTGRRITRNLLGVGL